MNREIHVRFWESAGVRFPCATQQFLMRGSGSGLEFLKLPNLLHGPRAQPACCVSRSMLSSRACSGSNSAPEFDTKRCKYLIYIDHVRELPLQEA